jgi:alpha-tubulin suppressor-like RCC1 family protein
VQGDNGSGKLGLGHYDYVDVLTENTNNIKQIGQIIGIYCGEYTSYILNNTFELFSCGYNICGSLC